MKVIALSLVSLSMCCPSFSQSQSDSPAIIHQVSFSDQSPNVSNVTGNVTIVYYGCVAATVTSTVSATSYTSALDGATSGPSTRDYGLAVGTMPSLFQTILQTNNVESGWQLPASTSGSSIGDNGLLIASAPSVFPAMNDPSSLQLIGAISGSSSNDNGL